MLHLSHLRDATEGLFDPSTEPALPSEPPVAGRVSAICPTTEERVLFHQQLYTCFSAQSWSNKELVVVDTGAHPSPFLAMKAAEDPQLVYRHYRTMGTSWSVGLKRNLAVCFASGQTIAHFDDDDLYAPVYLERMVGVLGSAEAVTLSSWFVCDACTGMAAFVNPSNDGSEESWILGYGFSHVYRRAVCLKHPFPHEHFAEDYRFLVSLRDAPGGQVKTHSDDEGIVLHMQQGLNLSTSHGHREVSLEDLRKMPVSSIPGFDSILQACSGCRLVSPFVSVGENFRMYLRPTPHQNQADMRYALSRLGVAVQTCSGLSERDIESDESDAVALAACRISRCGEVFIEPGRSFAPAKRFLDETPLPGDVPRNTLAEQAALLHMARVLMRRCPARLASAAKFEGWMRLQIRALSHIAVANLVAHFVRYFPRVRVEVCFDSEGVVSDPCAGQRAAVMQVLAQAMLNQEFAQQQQSESWSYPD